MRLSVFRSTLIAAIVLSLALVGASVSRADDGGGDSQLIDTTHQVSDIGKKISDLRAKGQYARGGKLAAAADCGFGDPSQAFLPWGDDADYSLAPQGDFSDTSAWSFKNTGPISTDPNPLGTNALAFVKGDSEAISPAMCVSLENPTIRLMMKDVGGNGKSDIKVTVLYEDVNGSTQHLTLAKLRASSSWNPAIAVPIAVNMLATAAVSGWTAVAFDFKVEGLQKNESLELGSLYVDPYVRR
jgi:hypothetical protein